MATLPARRPLSILHLAGKASIRRRPVNSALGVTQAMLSHTSVVAVQMRSPASIGFTFS